MTTTEISYIIIIAILSLYLLCALTCFLLSRDKIYRSLLFLFDIKAYSAWRKAYKGEIYAVPNECDEYEKYIGCGVEWWGYARVKDKDIICLLYKNMVEHDDKIRVAVLRIGNFPSPTTEDILFTHYWTPYGDRLVEKALPCIIDNYRKNKKR